MWCYTQGLYNPWQNRITKTMTSVTLPRWTQNPLSSPLPSPLVSLSTVLSQHWKECAALVPFTFIRDYNVRFWSTGFIVDFRCLWFYHITHICHGKYCSSQQLSVIAAFCFRSLQSSHFPFLGVNGTLSVYDMRCRTTFYTALGRLLMVDLGEDEERFDTFMVPLTTAFEFVGTQLANADKGGPWNEAETKVFYL